jgi:RNA polymerase-binding transcription factor DksA
MIREAETQAYRHRLLALLSRLEIDRAQLKNEALRATGGEASGSLSDVPIHQADLAADSFDEGITLDLLENEEQLIEEINPALARLDEGVFGRCAVCGKDISRDRLQALPYARSCGACAESLTGKGSEPRGAQKQRAPGSGSRR